MAWVGWKLAMTWMSDGSGVEGRLTTQVCGAFEVGGSHYLGVL